MSATFNALIAAALLAVELLLFEWRPRSVIPVALASGTAAVVRPFLLGGGALFPTPPHSPELPPISMLACVLVGIAGGGLVIGLGGLVFPQALGVGYDTLGALLGQVRDLGGLTRFRYLGRRAGATADDGRGARRRTAVTVLTMRRSILTEKISRRGLHLSREYSVDPLEIMFVRDVMRTNVVALPTDVSLRSLGESLKDAHRYRGRAR